MKRAAKRSRSAVHDSLLELVPQAASGNLKAIRKFRELGESAIPALVAAMQGPSPPGIHGRDFLENLTAAIAEACHERAGEMIRIIRAGELKADPFMWLAVSALHGSSDPEVNDLFLSLLQHKESLIREAAAEGIIQRRDRRAIDPLLALLRKSRADSMLTFIIVSGMRRVPERQDAQAIPVLERLLARRRISPGTVTEGTALLATLRKLD
jgi:HEAT repeat protein